MDIVDVRTFQKNAKPIMQSTKVLKSAVRSVVGPTMRLKVKDPNPPKQKRRSKSPRKPLCGGDDDGEHLLQGSLSTISFAASFESSKKDVNKVSWAAFVQKEDSVTNHSHGHASTVSIKEEPIKEDTSPSRQRTPGHLGTLSHAHSKILQGEDGPLTSRTHSTVGNPISRPNTSGGSALPYHTSQSIQSHQARMLEFHDFLVPRQGSPPASISPNGGPPAFTDTGKTTPAGGGTSGSPSRARTAASSTPMGPEFSAAHSYTDLNGSLVPSNVLKDTMISTVRRQTDHLNREVLYSSNNSVAMSDSTHAKHRSSAHGLLPRHPLDAQFSQITTNTDDFHHLHGGTNKPSGLPTVAAATATGAGALGGESSNQGVKIMSLSHMTKGEQGFNDSTRSLPIGDFIDDAGGGGGSGGGKQASSSLIGGGGGGAGGVGHRVISTKDIDESAAWKSLLSSTSRAKLASIVRVEDDYSMKWMRMKARRDAQRQKEEQRQQNLALRHFFRRVQINAEQNELHHARLEMDQARDIERRHHQEHIVEHHRAHDTLYHQRKKDREHEKRKETRQLKRTIARSVAEARELIANEIADQHATVVEQKNRMKESRWQEFSQFSQSRGWVHPGSQYLDGGDEEDDDPDGGGPGGEGRRRQRQGDAMEPPWGGSLEELSSFTGHSDTFDVNGHANVPSAAAQQQTQQKSTAHVDGGRSLDNNTSSLLDDTTSSVVDIPAPLQRKLKQATSLRAYQAAKQEIKEYYDSMMSMRIHRFVHSKEVARRQVEARERTQVTKIPFHAGMFFSDSITLHSNAMDDSRSDVGEGGGGGGGGWRSTTTSPQRTAAAAAGNDDYDAMRAVTAALTDPAATPLPPYHLDPRVVAESYGLALPTSAMMSAAAAAAGRQPRSPSGRSPPRRGNSGGLLPLHPSDSAHLMMRHTPLTPLLPAVPSSMLHSHPQSPPTTLQQLQATMAHDPERELSDTEYAAYIAAAAAAVTGAMDFGPPMPSQRPSSQQQQQQQQQRSMYSGIEAHSSHDGGGGLPPTSLGAKKKSMIMKSFAGNSNNGPGSGAAAMGSGGGLGGSFSATTLGVSSSGGDAATLSMANVADLFQLSGQKRNSLEAVTKGATYASLLRSQSIRRSLSGFLPINASNFDAETEQQSAILDKFQSKKLPGANAAMRMSIAIPSVPPALTTSSSSAAAAIATTTAAAAADPSIAPTGAASRHTSWSLSPTNTGPSMASSVMGTGYALCHIAEHTAADHGGEGDSLSPRSQLSTSTAGGGGGGGGGGGVPTGGGSSVASSQTGGNRSSQQVRLVLPPVGLSRSNSTNSSISLNRGMSRPVLMDALEHDDNDDE